MKRIIEKLLIIVRTFLSRLGFSAGPASLTERPPIVSDHVKLSCSVGVLEQDADREPVRPQTSESDSDQATHESAVEEAPEATPCHGDGVLGANETAASAKSPAAVETADTNIPALDASVQEPRAVHSPAESSSASVSESGLNREESAVIQELDSNSSEMEQAPIVAGGGLDSDLPPYRQKGGNIESQIGEPPSSEKPIVVSGDSTVGERTDTATSPAPADERSHETQLPPIPIPISSGMSDRSEERDVSDLLRMGETGHEQAKDDLSASTCKRDLIGADPESEAPSLLVGEDQQSQEELPDGPVAVPVDGQVETDSEDLGHSLPEQDHPITSAETRLTTGSTKGVSSPRRPAPREDAGEYKILVRDVSEVDQEYARWNRVIVEQLLLVRASTENVYLCVNPRILAKTYGEAGFDLLTPDQAEQRFSTATAQIYRKRVLKHRDRLHVLRRCGDGGFPDCAGFLAASVLAAYRMQFDEEVSGNAYYKRLADLLGCGTQGVHPVGFDPAVFESLWMFLHDWLREVHGRRLAMPRGDVGFRRFVALPLAHVPLRSLDVDKLPAFFSWAGYQPGGRVRHDRLLSDLRRWQQARNALTPTGAESLSDDRSDAVAAQVSAELESWDGSFYESESKRTTALVEVQFDVVQRSPVFFYLPRRPPGFPEVFDGGERVFEASEEGWYDPAQVRPEDGELLGNGFEWPSNVDGVQFMLRRPGAVVVALTPSSICSGFLSNRRLLRGVRCSVLVRNNVLSTVQDYLSEVAQSALNPVSHPLLPNGWAMFRDFTARVHVEAPPGLEALEVDPNVELIVAGGLRVGRRWSWLAGAPPRILVSGVEAQDSIKVNDAPVEVGVNGELPTGDVFAEPGEYIIEAGRVRRRIEIAQPQVSVLSEADRPEPIDGHRRRIALPYGSWTLIGPSPDQVCQAHGGFFRGTIASCPFQPSWAVQVGAGPGAVVAALASPSPPRTVSLHRLTGQARKVVERWTSIVYEAHIRRPRFIGLEWVVPDAGAVDTWRMYAALAKEIKRSLKRRR